jgi:outer membrane protein assembly factor BamB
VPGIALEANWGEVATRVSFMFWSLFSLIAAKEVSFEPAIFKRNHYAPIQPQDVMIVNTLDGCLHGIKKSNGKLLWSQKMQDFAMIRVKDGSRTVNEAVVDGTEVSQEVRQELILIPEPGGDGDLYYAHEHSLKKFDKSLKEMVSSSIGTIDRNHMFTGYKDTEIYAIDPMQGTIIGKFGQTGPSFCDHSTKNAIFIGRTEYHLRIWERDSDNLLWNISYVEFTPTGSALPPLESTSTLHADVNGRFALKEQDKGIAYIH